MHHHVLFITLKKYYSATHSTSLNIDLALNVPFNIRLLKAVLVLCIIDPSITARNLHLVYMPPLR